MPDITYHLRSIYRDGPPVGRLEVSRRESMSNPGYWVAFIPHKGRKPVLEGLIGDAPGYGDRGPAQAARAFVSFAQEPSAWDTEAEREASRYYGEDIANAAEQHRLLRSADDEAWRSQVR